MMPVLMTEELYADLSKLTLIKQSPIMSRMLLVCSIRKLRSAAVSPWPNSRRKSCRGLFSTGSGVDAVRNDSVPEKLQP